MGITQIEVSIKMLDQTIIILDVRDLPTREISLMLGIITLKTLAQLLSDLRDRETTQCRIQGSEVGRIKGQAPQLAIKKG